MCGQQEELLESSPLRSSSEPKLVQSQVSTVRGRAGLGSKRASSMLPPGASLDGSDEGASGEDGSSAIPWPFLSPELLFAFVGRQVTKAFGTFGVSSAGAAAQEEDEDDGEEHNRRHRK